MRTPRFIASPLDRTNAGSILHLLIFPLVRGNSNLSKFRTVNHTPQKHLLVFVRVGIALIPLCNENCTRSGSGFDARCCNVIGLMEATLVVKVVTRHDFGLHRETEQWHLQHQIPPPIFRQCNCKEWRSQIYQAPVCSTRNQSECLMSPH